MSDPATMPGKVGALDFHPLANLFPLIEGQAFADLVADVAANGIREPIVILDDKILDGRNRYRAGIAAGLIDPGAPAHNGIAMQGWCVLFLAEQEGDPLAWVLSKNLHRRHLDESQRAMVGARLEQFGHGGRRQQRPAAGQQDAALQLDRGRVAEMVNVSPRLIASAKKVIATGAPELTGAVERGEVRVSAAEKLLALPAERQAEAVQTGSARQIAHLAKQLQRDATERRLAGKVAALPERQYGVILADPPWRFEPYSRATGLDRAADNHYPTQETDEIVRLPVAGLAAPNCALFLWATAPMLPDALRVMRFWGFDYRTQLIWRKADTAGRLVLGTGYWLRNAHEILLLGIKGAVPAPVPGTQWASVFDAAPGRHSAKPDSVYTMIEQYFPHLPRIELNARTRRTGWDAWGLEAPEAMSAEGEGHGGVDEAGAHGDIDGCGGDGGAGAVQRGFATSTACGGPPPPRAGEDQPVDAGTLAVPEAGGKAAGGEPAGAEGAAGDAADELIAEGYAAGGPRLIARLSAATGLSANQVKHRARVLGLSNRDRQRAAVAAANRLRGGGSR